MPKLPTLLEQFRSFCYHNRASDFEQAVRYFAVFGGMGWEIDLTQPLWSLIEKKVLANYRYIHGDITLITQSNPTYHSLLSAIAVGDRREYSSFKRAKVGREQGEDTIDFLIDKKIVKFEKSIEKPIRGNDDNSDKLSFTEPFMRFWFANISPYYKGIKEGNYIEVEKKWSNTEGEFANLIYNQLFVEMLKISLTDDPIVKIGSYWDKNVEIDILAQRRSGKLIAGSCKHSKSKANKSVLSKLEENCTKAELDIDTFVIYSKNKFSNELKKLSSENLKLYSQRNLTILWDNLTEKDLLKRDGKLY